MGNEICELAVHSFPWHVQPCRFLLQELEGHEQHIQHVPEAGQEWSLFLPASAVLLPPCPLQSWHWGSRIRRSPWAGQSPAISTADRSGSSENRILGNIDQKTHSPHAHTRTASNYSWRVISSLQFKEQVVLSLSILTFGEGVFFAFLSVSFFVVDLNPIGE